MALVMRKALGEERVGAAVADVVEGAFVEVVAGGLAGWTWWGKAALIQIPGGVARQFRATVYTVIFQRQPMRADVAFFKYVDAQAISLRHWMHVAVNFAAVAEHYDVGKPTHLHSIDIPIC
jgi:hypothetical protein